MGNEQRLYSDYDRYYIEKSDFHSFFFEKNAEFSYLHRRLIDNTAFIHKKKKNRQVRFRNLF